MDSIGIVDTFRLLRSRKAQLGPRTLQRAAEAASSFSDEDEGLAQRRGIVRYLASNLGLDVNAMDTEGQMPSHWGRTLSGLRCKQRPW